MIIPFYTSSGTAGKVDGQGNLFGVGEFFPIWGVSSITGWHNKTNYTWKGEREETAIANDDRSKYYGSTKLRRIANELDDLLPDFKAMVKEIGPPQLPGMPRADNSMHAEYGLDQEQELNQGFAANGIVPVKISEVSKVRENIKKAKRITGVDGPITYNLVPFKNGHNFAYRYAGIDSGRFYVLVDINPASTRDRLRALPRGIVPAGSYDGVPPTEEEVVSIKPTYPPSTSSRRKEKQRVTVGRRNPGGDDNE